MSICTQPTISLEEKPISIPSNNLHCISYDNQKSKICNTMHTYCHDHLCCGGQYMTQCAVPEEVMD